MTSGINKYFKTYKEFCNTIKNIAGKKANNLIGGQANGKDMRTLWRFIYR